MKIERSRGKSRITNNQEYSPSTVHHDENNGLTTSTRCRSSHSTQTLYIEPRPAMSQRGVEVPRHYGKQFSIKFRSYMLQQRRSRSDDFVRSVGHYKARGRIPLNYFNNPATSPS